MKRSEQGFTLIEVMISLLIVGMWLTVLLEAQASSMRKAARARDMTIGTLLARSKMVDIEKELFDEGFAVGEDEEKGDFGEEGYKDITWKYRVIEPDLDLSLLTGMCEGFGEEGGDAGGCDSMLGGLGAPMETFTQELTRAFRIVVLEVKWPDGKYHDSVRLSAIVTRDNFMEIPGP